MIPNKTRTASGGALGSGRGEQAIAVCSMLYAARSAMRGLWGAEFPAKMVEYQDHILAGMKKHRCDEMQATMKMVADLQAKHPGSGMTQTLLLAAYVEMLEPSAQNI